MSLPIINSKIISKLIFGALASSVFLSGAFIAKADEVKDHFDKGLKLYTEKKLDSSLSEFNLALKGSPKDPTILRWVGFLNLEKQNYEAARSPLEQAVALEPKSVVAHLNLGNVYDGLKQYSKALGEFKEVTKLKPNSPDAYYNIGLLYSKVGKWNDAVDALRTSAKLDEASVKERNEKAVEKDRATQDPYTQDALGAALNGAGNSKEALAAYQKAVSIAPANSAFNYHLAIAWLKMSDAKLTPLDTAVSNSKVAFKTSLDGSSAKYDLTERYGEALFEKNANEAAAEQFSNAVELDKTQFGAIYHLGLAKSRLGQYAKAEEAYNTASALLKSGDPKLRISLLNNLSFVQFKQNKVDDALMNLKALTSEFPSETVAWVNLASCYRSKSDEEGEMRALKGAIENGNGYKNLGQIRAAMGSLLYRKKDFTGAFDQYAQANALQPGKAEILNDLALSEQQLGKIDDSIKHFLAANKANPKFGDAFNNLGVAYETRFNTSMNQEDIEKALSSYNKALLAEPSNALARKNKERLESGRKKK